MFDELWFGVKTSRCLESNLEVTPRYVNSVRFDSILTDAQLWMSQQTIDQLFDATADKLWHHLQLFSAKLCFNGIKPKKNSFKNNNVNISTTQNECQSK